MSDSEKFSEKRLRLKKEVISRAISQGRGAEAIAKINAIYRNIQATWLGTDDDVIGNWSASLTDGQYRITKHDLDEAGSVSHSKYLRAYNMSQALQGSSRRLKETEIVSGNSTIN